MVDARARKTPKLEMSGIEFIPPHTVRTENGEQRVGAVVYRLLQTLFEASRHELPVAEVEGRVWGRPVNRNTLHSTCRRARKVLIELNHPLRATTDGDLVVLV